MCRSAEYNYVTLQCRLADIDRRTLRRGIELFRLKPTQGVDYFENLCLSGENAYFFFNTRQFPTCLRLGIFAFFRLPPPSVKKKDSKKFLLKLGQAWQKCCLTTYFLLHRAHARTRTHTSARTHKRAPPPTHTHTHTHTHSHVET